MGDFSVPSSFLALNGPLNAVLSDGHLLFSKRKDDSTNPQAVANSSGKFLCHAANYPRVFFPC